MTYKPLKEENIHYPSTYLEGNHFLQTYLQSPFTDEPHVYFFQLFAEQVLSGYGSIVARWHIKYLH